MDRTCPVCGKLEQRSHRHDRDNAVALAIGRFNAEQERKVLRALTESARKDPRATESA